MLLPLRPLPEETIQNLVPPLPGFPYFAHAGQLRFQPRAEGYSAENAWWLADASFLVYGAADFIEAAFAASPLPGLGFELDWLGTREENRGMVLRNDEALLIVFRGTRLHSHSLFDVAEIVMINEDDLRTDGQFVPEACPAGGHVHSGFLAAYATISDRLDEVVAQQRRPGQRLWLAGHSLGGALATLAAAHLARDAVAGVYTFGSLRVGDAVFARALPARSYYRVVHRDDWVPLVPPEFLGYVHGGTLVSLTDSGRRRIWSDLAWSRRAIDHADPRRQAAFSFRNVRPAVSGFRPGRPRSDLLRNAVVESIAGNLSVVAPRARNSCS